MRPGLRRPDRPRHRRHAQPSCPSTARAWRAGSIGSKPARCQTRWRRSVPGSAWACCMRRWVMPTRQRGPAGVGADRPRRARPFRTGAGSGRRGHCPGRQPGRQSGTAARAGPPQHPRYATSGWPSAPRPTPAAGPRPCSGSSRPSAPCVPTRSCGSNWPAAARAWATLRAPARPPHGHRTAGSIAVQPGGPRSAPEFQLAMKSVPRALYRIFIRRRPPKTMGGRAARPPVDGTCLRQHQVVALQGSTQGIVRFDAARFHLVPDFTHATSHLRFS